MQRAESKLISKRKSLARYRRQDTEFHVGHHYDPTKGPLKNAYIEIEAAVFGSSPVKISVKLESDDTLILGTRALAHLVSEDELADAVIGKPVDAIIENLEELAGSADLAVIALRTVGEPGPAAEPDLPLSLADALDQGLLPHYETSRDYVASLPTKSGTA